MMKTAIITGASGGIGLEITKAVVKAGYHVVMACRDTTKAEIKKEEILSNYTKGSIEIIKLDLSSLEEVSHFAFIIAQKFDSVDLLMNNAGVIPTCFEQTCDGFEQAVCVNYMAPYLLTTKLIPLMPQGARIVNMTSCTYIGGKIHMPEFFNQGKKGRFQRLGVYCNTKLAVIFFTFELSKHLQAKGITVNAADPGIVSTNMITMKKWFDPLTDIFFRPFIKTPQQGAKAAIQLLLDDKYEKVSGEVLTSGGIKKISSKLRNHPVRAQLWTETEKRIRQKLETKTSSTPGI